jgi:hypothetical protein
LYEIFVPSGEKLILAVKKRIGLYRAYRAFQKSEKPLSDGHDHLPFIFCFMPMVVTITMKVFIKNNS